MDNLINENKVALDIDLNLWVSKNGQKAIIRCRDLHSNDIENCWIAARIYDQFPELFWKLEKRLYFSRNIINEHDSLIVSGKYFALIAFLESMNFEQVDISNLSMFAGARFFCGFPIPWNGETNLQSVVYRRADPFDLTIDTRVIRWVTRLSMDLPDYLIPIDARV